MFLRFRVPRGHPRPLSLLPTASTTADRIRDLGLAPLATREATRFLQKFGGTAQAVWARVRGDQPPVSDGGCWVSDFEFVHRRASAKRNRSLRSGSARASVSANCFRSRWAIRPSAIYAALHKVEEISQLHVWARRAQSIRRNQATTSGALNDVIWDAKCRCGILEHLG